MSAKSRSGAKLLLRNSDKTVAEIAKCTGFCTPSHLSNTFRDSTGETPRHYRAYALNSFATKSASAAFQSGVR